jgi:hypothetical protein
MACVFVVECDLEGLVFACVWLSMVCWVVALHGCARARLVVVVAVDVNPFVTHSERLLCAVVFY